MQVTHYEDHWRAFINTAMKTWPLLNNAKYLEQLADIS